MDHAIEVYASLISLSLAHNEKVADLPTVIMKLVIAMIAIRPSLLGDAALPEKVSPHQERDICEFDS